MKIQPRVAKLFIAVALLLVLASLVFAQQAFNLDILNPTDPDGIVVSSALSALVFLVLLVFAFVLLRTVVKVWVERKQHKPGSKFKTSLLVWLVALTLLPAICVFAYSFGLLNRNISKMFSVPVDAIFDATEDNKQQWQAEHEAWARSILAYLRTAPDLSANLESTRETFKLSALLVIDSSGSIDRLAAGKGIPVDAVPRDALKALGPFNESFVETKSGWIGAIRIQARNGPRVLAAVFPPLPDIAASNRAIAVQKDNYNVLIKQQRNFRDTYVYLLVLMTVLVMFAAVWLGLFLSKRITVPIEALAEATREISAGNLNHQVTVKAEDELGLLITLFNDMTNRLQTTTRELENRRHYMEVILESIPTGVISIDSSGHIQTLNRAARTMFSIRNMDGVKALDDVFKGADLREISTMIADAEKTSVTREFGFVTPGRPGHSAVTVERLANGGAVLVVEDLTEVVRAQRASAWREVARRLAHEIKNPLTPILLSAERITRNIERLPAAAPRVSTVIRECVGLIVDEVSSLKNLVDEFVRFARLPTVARSPNSLRELIDKTMPLYEGRMEDVAVTIALPDDLPLILIDPMQMKRVLINLIDNALEAMGAMGAMGAMEGQPGRKLSIAADLARDGTMVRLTIEDSGRGISTEDRERLFAPYFSTRKDGTGLGLSIVSRIIADHGGYIGVEPNTPRGTRFMVELPVCLESSLLTTNPASASR